MKYHAIGAAMKNEIATSFINSFDNKLRILDTDAPITLRIPISLERLTDLAMVRLTKFIEAINKMNRAIPERI